MSVLRSSLLTVARRAPTSGSAADESVGVVWLLGEHDCSTDGALCQNLARAISLDQQTVVVDLSMVDFIGASTIRLLVLATEYLRQRSQRLVVRSPSKAAVRAFALWHPGDLLTIGSTSDRQGLIPTESAPEVACREREELTTGDSFYLADGVGTEPSAMVLAV